MELKILLVIYFIFRALFLGGGVLFGALGVFTIQYNSIIVEFFIPYGPLSELRLGFCFDFPSLMFFRVVSIISGTVFYYRKFYIDINILYRGSDNSRFMGLLFLFVVSMFILVFSST